jgi:DNA-binding NarL/FixJ family response regulator
MRVLVADDQKQVRSALQMLLKHELNVSMVAEASEAKSLLALIQATHPDLLLIDWGLPGLSAIGSLPTLRRACPKLLVIALSGRPEIRQEALAAGADFFVSKVDPPEQLLSALHTVGLSKK